LLFGFFSACTFFAKPLSDVPKERSSRSRRMSQAVSARPPAGLAALALQPSFSMAVLRNDSLRPDIWGVWPGGLQRRSENGSAPLALARGHNGGPPARGALASASGERRWPAKERQRKPQPSQGRFWWWGETNCLATSRQLLRGECERNQGTCEHLNFVLPASSYGPDFGSKT
jgi:hypothetical protein